MQSWKRTVIIGASLGAGFAMAAGAILGLFRLYSSRPKPWNPSAIRATFDKIATEGKDGDLVFYYFLQNNTPEDYQVSDSSEITIDAKFGNGQGREALVHWTNSLRIDTPLLVPAKRTAWAGIHFAKSYTDACIQEIATSPPDVTGGRNRLSYGNATIQSLASKVRKQSPLCKSSGDDELVSQLIRIFPDYWRWLNPSDREKIRSVQSPNEKALVAFIREHFHGLEGFVLYDEARHREIDFPRGW